jgi:hypothetical protein
LQRITDTLAGTDLSKATALALTPEDPQQQRRLLDSIKSNAVFDKSPAAAVAWADSLPAEWQASTITEVLPIMIQGASPEKTAQISDIVLQRINSEPPETASRWTGLAKDTVSRLASGDPAACELFLTKLPETARKTAIKAVTGQCCGFFTDPDRVESTLKWITGMNDAALRQTLSGSICGELAKQHLPPEVSQRVQQTLTPFIR